MKNLGVKKLAKNKFKKLMIGVEVECIIDVSKIDFLSIGAYHSGNLMVDKDSNNVEGWTVEMDGSINRGRRFSSPQGIEFVSQPFTSRQEFFRGIDRFIKCMSCDGQYELKEVMEVNSSCGCHIHLSKGNKKFAKMVHKYLYDQTKINFFKSVKSSTLPEKVKTAVMAQYYRSYAKKASLADFNKNRGEGGDRRTEWNFRSEFGGNGLEWRSFNVRSVETWKDFKMLMSIAFKSLEPMFMALSGWHKGNKYAKEVNFNNVEMAIRTINVKTKKTKDKKIFIKTWGEDEIRKTIIRKTEVVKIKKKNTTEKQKVNSLTKLLERALSGE